MGDPARLDKGLPRRLGQAAILLILSVVLAAALTSPPSPLAVVDDWFEAVLFRFFAPAVPPSDRVVIVGITEETLNQLAYRSPIDRGFLAQVLSTIDAAHPAAIGFDLLFDQPTEPAKDDTLRRAIDAAGSPIVFAATNTLASFSTERNHFSAGFLAGRRLGDVTLLRERSFAGTIDRYPACGDLGRPSFAAALAAAVGVTAPRAAFRIAWRRTAKDGPFPIYPAHILRVMPPDWLRGKIVLVGSLLSGQDEHRTPISLFTGPSFGIEIHAHALAQILDGATATMPPWIPPTALVTAAATGLLLAGLLDGPALIAGLLMLVIGIWVGPVALFASGGPLVLPMPSTLAFGMAAAGLRFWRGRAARRDHRILRQIFARHVSAPVAQELWRQRDAFLAGGRPRPQELVATVLFADVAGFTTLCERLTPSPLIDWLDQYIDVMVQAISANHGVVLRFVGDGILAAFSTPIPRRDETEIDRDAQNATRAALAMVAAMRRLNEAWRSQGLPVAGLRIGLHTGPVVAGCLGRGEKLEYCLLGDTANTGARIEALGKDYVTGPDECIILVGAATRDRLHAGFVAQPVGEIRLRGKEQSVGIYQICAEAPSAALGA